MLFNSYAFLFVFLPIALAGYQLAGRINRNAVVLWLGLISLAFYAYWRPAYVLLLLSSIGLNYLAAALITRQLPNTIGPRLSLWLAIVSNLALLGYFKYLYPTLGLLAHLDAHPNHIANTVLPLGISFFTFTQIAYLVDLEQGAAAQEDFASYLLFVSFFPHLIAGPILHHSEMMPQFHQARRYRLRSSDLAVGFSWFTMGLAKKVLLADTFAHTANALYSTPGSVGLFVAWRGVVGYALQLYFDFSGYSDMALGLARMFSIDFPLNFASPFKASNIIEYWQRWHITLTRYVTAYLYNPLQLWISDRRQARGLKISRKALATPEGFMSMLAFPMLTTFAITGIWHGAGTRYIVFGLLHGTFLTVNHAWRIFRNKSAQTATGSSPLVHAGSVLLTFLCVISALTFFRGSSCTQAINILSSMVGVHGLGSFRLFDESAAAAFSDFATVFGGLVIVWAFPNTQQILQRFKPAIAQTQWDHTEIPPRFLWEPCATWALAAGLLFFFSLVYLQQPSTFLYFQF
jgi:alginate O-acetyltransferase complex protein AlgI